MERLKLRFYWMGFQRKSLVEELSGIGVVFFIHHLPLLPEPNHHGSSDKNYEKDDANDNE
jgi:hypothetical protein